MFLAKGVRICLTHVRRRTKTSLQTAGLLFSEYICLAILSFPWYARSFVFEAVLTPLVSVNRSFSVLGMAPGVIVTIAVAASVQYTSLILWRFCLKHPEVRDVCDIGKMLFGGSQLAYNITAVFFILNNTFIQGSSLWRISFYSCGTHLSFLQLCTVSSVPNSSIPSQTEHLVR